MSECAKITKNDLRIFCEKALLEEGMRENYAKITAEVLSETDMFGTHSHGTKNLYDYIKKIRIGGMNLNKDIEILSEGPSYAHMDGNAIIGMVPAYKAMEMAIKKSEETGIAICAVKNSSHFGAAGYYSVMAAKENKIGLVFSNVDANMTIPGAREKVIGNNPMSYGIPAGKYPPVFLDIAMSTVASLKVIQAKKDGKQIPDQWIVDKEGLPTTDPSKYPDEGAMQPMAAHKGYGIALMIEVITAVLTGGGILKEVPSWLFKLEENNNVSHTFIAIDPEKFIGIEGFTSRMEEMIEQLHSAPKAAGNDKIFYPGEIEWGRYEISDKEGLQLPDDVCNSLLALSEDVNIPIAFIKE